MDKISTIDELNKKINFLELKQSNDLILLKDQVKISHESIKPINLIQNTLKELTNSPNFKQELLNTSISLGDGYLSKKIAVGSTHNPLKQLLGTIVQWALQIKCLKIQMALNLSQKFNKQIINKTSTT